MRHPAIQVGRRFIGPAPRRQLRRGLTLAECVLALVVLSLAVTAVAFAVTAGQMQSAEALRRSKAAMLADALMDEILTKTYAAPSGGNPPSRTAYGQVGQYNGFNEAPGNLKTAAGVLYPTEFQQFRRTATVATGTVTLAGLGAATSGLVITVTVRDDGGAVSTLTRFMVRPS